MRTKPFGAALLCALAFWLIGVRPEARGADVVSRPSLDAAAFRELLEGTRGQREAWKVAPALVILTSVMDYTSADMTAGYTATEERLTPDDVARLTSDLTQALGELTDGRLTAFSAIRLDEVSAGQTATVFRAGQIVAGRYRGVQARTGSLGYGGRTSRNGTITSAAVILDRDFDRDSNRRLLLRTHELGHALGYNHVESCPSVMNPRVGSGITDFDRGAIKQAFAHFGEQ